MKYLAPRRALFTDGLVACFNSFDLEGHFHWEFITQGGKNSKTSILFGWQYTIIGNVMSAKKITYHGTDNRHFRRYLGEFCYRVNRRFKLELMIENLIIQIKSSFDSH